MEYYTDFFGGPIIYLRQNTWVWHLEGGDRAFPDRLFYPGV